MSLGYARGARLQHPGRRPGAARRGAGAARRAVGGLHAGRASGAPPGAQARRGGRGAAGGRRSIVPLHAEAGRAWRLHSWDRFHDPQAGGPVTVTYGRPFEVAPGDAGSAGPGWRGRRRGSRSSPGEDRHEPARRHPPGDALALDQPRGPTPGSRGSALLPVVGALAGGHGGAGARLPPRLVARSATCRCPSVAVGNLTVGGLGQDADRDLDRAATTSRQRPDARDPAPRLRRRRDPGAPAGGAGARVVVADPDRAAGRRAGAGRRGRRCWCSTTRTSGSTSGGISTSPS